MKVVILAGGLGTRLSEETKTIPKPMVEIGGKPILWHIMKLYSHYGFSEFIICLGYKGYMIKEYFHNYYLHNSDFTIDLKSNDLCYHKANHKENWKVSLIDTGQETMTGGRIKRIKEYVNDETFMLTYGDGVSDVNIKELLKFHKTHGRLATVTAVKPEGRFGALKLEEEKVLSFAEKMDNGNSWINAGFFVLEPEIFKYIKEDGEMWEKKPIETIAKENNLRAYFHEGFWKPMDMQRDKLQLEELWEKGAPWKIWK